MKPERIILGSYEAEIAPAWDGPELRAVLTEVRRMLSDGERIYDGRNQLTRCRFSADGRDFDLAVKSFGHTGGWRDRMGNAESGKAMRSWRVALRLMEGGAGTPEPITVLERRVKGRLVESHFMTVYVEEATSLREELNWIYTERPYSGELMALLQTVADAVRTLHQARVVHFDLGNQNILLHRQGPGVWTDVRFIDLNRARCREEALTLRERARDLSRIALPSDFRRIFFEMIFEGGPPAAFVRWEQMYRDRFSFHSKTRRWRHPLRERKNRDNSVYLPARDIWIWDECSGQAISAWTSRDRRRMHSARDGFRMVTSVLRDGPALYRAYQRLLQEAYQRPVEMMGRAGVAIQARPETEAWERPLLKELGPVPLLVRFYHHETEKEWAYSADVIHRLKQAGHPITIALVQDRRAVLDPELWRVFMEAVLDRVHEDIEAAEVGHAINRVKWGIWNTDEYRRWMQASATVMARYHGIQWMGPAGIDFEYYRVWAALDRLPATIHFSALSHHLYVDRRGAPENRQGRFSTLEKAALARAMAVVSPRCADRLVVSEVNWPLLGTGIYSPVGSPYIWPGREILAPNVSESDAAAYALRYLLITLCSGLVDRVFWWQLTAHGYGLTDLNRIRPAYEAFRLFVQHLAPARFVRHWQPRAGLNVWAFEAPEGRAITVLCAHPSPVSWTPDFAYDQVLDLRGKISPWQPDTPITGNPLLLLGTSKPGA